jgi:acyl-CoA synthetase (AMP-forming)/AMP-acid ligase II
MAGLRAVAVSAGYRPGDVLLQWVPLFHDMGLIGMLSLLMYGGEVVVFPPAAFLRRPAEVLAYFSEHHATMLTGPNFSYDYLLDALPPDRLAALDLSRWRLAFNGAEPVRAATVARFSAALAASGVTDTVMFPVYGMAEATLAVSFPRPGTPTTVISVDRDELDPGRPVTVVPAGHARAKPVVSVGYPVHGLEVRIAGDAGPLPPGCCGELQIRGDAVSTGYYGDPVASQDRRAGDGWLRTGDLGFSRDRELFILGRRKEMIIVYGQNFFPEDVEALVRPAPGLYRHRCVAFPLTGGSAEQMGVIAETEAVGPAAAALRADIAARLAAGLGLSQVQIHLVEPRWIPRTTSGKWQRALSARRITQRKESEPA